MRAPILLLTCSLVSLPAAADLYKVGAVGDTACTHNTLPAAVESARVNPGPDQIRLARNVAYVDQRIQLLNWTAANALTVLGGYDDCGDDTASTRTAVDGTPDHPVIEMTGTSDGLLTLRRLAIEGSGQQGIVVTGTNEITLSATFVRSNAFGGARVRGDAKLIVDVDSRVWNNTTPGAGGGISCDGTARVNVSGGVGGSGTPNHASVMGGGIYAAEDCEVLLFDGATVSFNDARDGAGIAAAGSALVLALGEAQGVVIEENAAVDRGGGVFASESAEVHLFNARVRRNRAGSRGGGLVATGDFALVSMFRANGACHASGCSTLESNVVIAGSQGAAAFAEAGGDLYLAQTWIAGSSAGMLANSSLVGADRVGSSLYLQSVAMLNNEVEVLIDLDSAAAIIQFVSASNNSPSGIVPSSPLRLVDAAGATLRASIFWPNGGFSISSDSVLSEARCLIVSDPTGLPPWAGVVSIADPMFLSPGSDLHLAPGSPAVDFCDGEPSPYTGARDVDYEQRAADQPANPDGSPGVPGGRVDIGFDEVDGWLLFSSFETGEFTEWEIWSP